MSDSETPVIEIPKATVHIERKLSTPKGVGDDFGNTVASIFLPVDLPIDPTDVAGYDSAIRTAFALAKGYVYEQLNVDHELNEDGIVLEKFTKQVEKAFPNSTTKPSASAKSAFKPVPNKPSGGDDSGHVCGKCGGTDFWYNSPESKKNPKSPDYKCKGCGAGIWNK